MRTKKFVMFTEKDAPDDDRHEARVAIEQPLERLRQRAVQEQVHVLHYLHDRQQRDVRPGGADDDRHGERRRVPCRRSLWGTDERDPQLRQEEQWNDRHQNPEPSDPKRDADREEGHHRERRSERLGRGERQEEQHSDPDLPGGQAEIDETQERALRVDATEEPEAVSPHRVREGVLDALSAHVAGERFVRARADEDHAEVDSHHAEHGGREHVRAIRCEHGLEEDERERDPVRHEADRTDAAKEAPPTRADVEVTEQHEEAGGRDQRVDAEEQPGGEREPRREHRPDGRLLREPALLVHAFAEPCARVHCEVESVEREHDANELPEERVVRDHRPTYAFSQSPYMTSIQSFLPT